MTMHLHHLLGCAPTPLAHYLKGLGILRIVSEQKDPEARGYWQDEHFCLITTLDREALEAFFLREYEPTPFVSPWNKGSGFYAKADPALSPIEGSRAPRFRAFREGIAAGRAQLSALSEADAAIRALKDRTKAKKGMTPAEKKAAAALKSDPAFKQELAAAERKFKALKAEFFTPLLLAWRGAHRTWMDAALVWLEEGKPAWPSLLGTGGNDGRLDFTNNAMQRLGDLFDMSSPEGAPNPGADELLSQCLWSTPSNRMARAAIGQFFPAAGGGANCSTGPEGGSLVNPWDFVLMLEGATLFSARATRRLDPNATSQASAPFAVRAHPVGHGTRGREKTQRGEQWMPLWAQPASAPAVAAMLGEARVQLGRRVAYRPIDVARAISRLGVARGITAFTRFGYLERNGQSNIAVTLGRIDVKERPRARLVDDLGEWLDRLQRQARDDHAPARLVAAEGMLADAVFAALTHDDSPYRWQAILLAASEIEALQAAGTALRAGPIPPLSPEWVRAADDGTAEWRLACALGSAAAFYPREGRPRDPVRHHWLPLHPGARRFLEQDKRLMRDPRVVMSGRDGLADCSAILERRLIEATQAGRRHARLTAARGCDAKAVDLAHFIDGRVDPNRTVTLARALMAVRWDAGRRESRSPRDDVRELDEAFMALRLCHLPWPLFDGLSIPTDGAILRRLLAGDGASAVEIALRRLRGAGLRPPLQAAFTDGATARRWAAALVFPISLRSARSMAEHLEPASRKEFR